MTSSSVPGVEAPLITLVCSTIGRDDELAALLDSVDASDIATQIEFVLIDQSADMRCVKLIESRPPRGPWTATTSGRGLSVGRNVGLTHANSPVVAFPDDNCRYPSGAIVSALDFLTLNPHLAGVSGRQTTSTGTPSMLRWLTTPTSIGRNNFMRTSISSTLFLRRAALPSNGPFDESIGAGSPGRCGAGEESDLLLRMLAAGHRIDYRPEIEIIQDDDRDAITETHVDKMAKYGVGLGHLWRRHSLPRWRLAYYSARKLAGSGVRAARGQRILARSDVAYLKGVRSGWRGILW